MNGTRDGCPVPVRTDAQKPPSSRPGTRLRRRKSSRSVPNTSRRPGITLIRDLPLMVGVVTVVLLLASCHGGPPWAKKDKDEKKGPEPVPVEIAQVEVRDMPSYLSATATLEPENQADILAKIGGEVQEIPVEEGDWVREGTPLAVLDGGAQKVALEELTARARSLKLELERIRALHDRQLASDRDLSNAQAAWEAAEAQRKGAALEYGYTTVIAPFSGRVAERKVDRGQTVNPGTPLFVLVDTDPLLARIHLPQNQISRVSLGQEVVVSLDAGTSSEFPGKVELISPVVDPRTGTVKVTCRVEDRKAELRAGSFVRVRIRTGIEKDALVIPQRALVSEGSETYVFVAEGDSALKVSVATGLVDGAVTQVVDGLKPGDRIVTVGHGGLKPGSPIRDIDAEPLAAAPDSSSQSEEVEGRVGTAETTGTPAETDTTGEKGPTPEDSDLNAAGTKDTLEVEPAAAGL